MQTSYPTNQPIGIHGGYYAAHESPDVVSYAAEILPVAPATVPEGVIPFGVAVTTGTNANSQCQAGDGSGGKFKGITVKSIEREQNCCKPEDGFSHTETMPVMQTGYLYITCPEGAAAHDPIDYDAAGVLHNGGGGTVIPGARWEFDVAAGELGVIRLMGQAHG